MKKLLPIGTKVRCVKNIDIPITPPIHIEAGEIGKIAGHTPDSQFGWYPIQFPWREIFLMDISTGNRMIEVLE